MKKLLAVLMFVGFMMAVPTQSQAMFPVISEPVTHRAKAFQGSWQTCGGIVSCSSIPSGFRTNQTGDAMANEFILNDPHILTSVSGWFKFNDFDGTADQTFLISLYQGTRDGGDSLRRNIPQFLFQTWNVQVSVSGSATPFIFESQDLYKIDNLNIPLPVGKYWVSAENGKGYVNAGDVHGYAVPEPSTMLLFGSGLLGAFVRRRKRS